jgi:tetratricopeptide (TPR) repeat protein
MSKANQEVVIEKDQAQVVMEKAKGFWEKYSRIIMIVSGIIILGAVAYIYFTRTKAAKEDKGADSIFVAQGYYGEALKSTNPDSLYNLALNGDGINKGFLWVISNYGSTDAGNLAKFYAGDCYYKLKKYPEAIDKLKGFSTSAKEVQARAWKLLADAYSYTGKNNEDALTYYKKAARHFTEDVQNSSEYMFMAAYFAHKVLNNKKEAVELYKELISKFPQSSYNNEADKYLAQLGEYTTE